MAGGINPNGGGQQSGGLGQLLSQLQQPQQPQQGGLLGSGLARYGSPGGSQGGLAQLMAQQQAQQPQQTYPARQVPINQVWRGAPDPDQSDLARRPSTPSAVWSR